MRDRAARGWTDWETATIPAPLRRALRPVFRMGFARTVLRDAHLLQGVPGTLVQGGLDFGTSSASSGASTGPDPAASW